MTQEKKPDFEKRMQRLQTIVESLERGDLPLEKGVALYKEGLSLAASCRKRLAEARHEVTLQDEDAVRDFIPDEPCPGGPDRESGPESNREDEPENGEQENA